MLTERQAAIIADALLLRADEWERGLELWFAINEREHLVEVHELHERGYLERRWDRERGDLLWRATPEAVTAQELHAMAAATINPN